MQESQTKELKGAALFPVRDPPAVADYRFGKLQRALLDKVERAFSKKRPLFSLAMYYPYGWAKEKGTLDEISDFQIGRQRQVVSLIRTGFLKRFESSMVSFDSSCQNLLLKLLAFAKRNSETPAEKRHLERWEGRNQEILQYTPRPVVSFIVRSVDEILRRNFGLEDGLADTSTWGEVEKRLPDLKRPGGTRPDEPFVRVLDPATGTGTFLVEAVDLIYKRMVEKWTKAKKSEGEVRKLWNEYVPLHLLPRLYGFELMMAPYAIAHMKLGLKLHDTGYRFASSERARIFLTNALEEAKDLDMQLAFMSEALAHESRAANEAKHNATFTAIVGNPPYSSSSRNKQPWIMQLIESYKTSVRGAETQIQALSDDYVKFMRFAQFQIQRSGSGVIGLITNNNFQSATTFRDMRQSISETFDFIQLVDLHGNSRLKERSSDGKVDENVFDILAGVCISIFSMLSKKQLFRSRIELVGSRQQKYSWLSENGLAAAARTTFYAGSPQFSFLAVNSELEEEYLGGIYLPELFGSGNYQEDKTAWYGSGFKTQQDEFAIAFTKEQIVENVKALLENNMKEAKLRSQFTMCNTEQWNFVTARKTGEAACWAKRTFYIIVA